MVPIRDSCWESGVPSRDFAGLRSNASRHNLNCFEIRDRIGPRPQVACASEFQPRARRPGLRVLRMNPEFHRSSLWTHLSDQLEPSTPTHAVERGSMALLNVGFLCRPSAAAGPCGPASLPLFSSVRIEAELQRILYALSMPQYLEASLEVPLIERVECEPDRRSFDRFRVNLFSRGIAKGSISGACLLLPPDKITYVWETESNQVCTRSLVEIRQIGGLGRFALRLRHGEFRSREEREWYAALWPRSQTALPSAGRKWSERSFLPAIQPGCQDCDRRPAVSHQSRKPSIPRSARPIHSHTDHLP